MTIRLEKMLWPTALVSLAVKLLLAAVLPVTSDEAYFVTWGRFVALGYYDHPPMVGWLLRLVSSVGESPVLIRLPAVLSTFFIALGIHSLLKPLDEKKAGLLCMFLLVSPWHLLNVIIATDTPFLIFAFVSAYFLLQALKGDGYAGYALSGAALGAAFLSKYFAVFLGLSYAAFFIGTRKDAKKMRGFLVLLLSAAPFVALNIFWNYTHCWANVMFNLLNRNRNEHYSLVKVLVFFAIQAYLFTPAVVYHLVRRARASGAYLSEGRRRVTDAGFAIFAVAFVAPLALFALLSVKKSIGLHWALGFYPFLYTVLFFLLTEEELTKTIRFTAGFTAIHLLLVGGALALPARYLQGNKNYPALILTLKPGEIIKHLDGYAGSFIFATPSYAASALLSYQSGDYFIVFGGGSYHGRQDDIQTDFRKLDGKDILVVRTSEPKHADYARFFESTTSERLTVAGAQFFVVKGLHFKYASYRDVVLREIRDKYYTIPAWLPASPDGYFFKKYFE